MVHTSMALLHRAVSCLSSTLLCCFLFFFNDPATTEIYTLSLHDALPIFLVRVPQLNPLVWRYALLDAGDGAMIWRDEHEEDRKSTRLNSSHTVISYAVFCLKKKKRKND